MKRLSRRPNTPYRFRKRNYGAENKRSRRLDMRKTEEFNFMLNKIVEDLPDSVRGALKGSLYSIASKQGTKEAREYISKKYDEGFIDDTTQRKLYDLLADYSKMR